MNSDKLKCPIHNISIKGICGDKNCNNSQLVCSSCHPNHCTNTNSHELLDLNQFLDSFYPKIQDNFNFKRLSDLVKHIKEVDKQNMNNSMENFNKTIEPILEAKIDSFDKNFISKLAKFKTSITTRLEKLRSDYQDAENRIDLISFETPENFTLEETKKFFNKNSNNIKDMENMINLVKKYSDNEKLSMNQKDMETIIYSKNLSDVDSMKIIKDKYDDILKEATQGLKDILQSTLFRNDNSLVILKEVKKFTMDPSLLKFKQDITDKCQKSYTIDSIFAAFITADQKEMVAWATPTFSIEVYSLKTNSIVATLTGHAQHVFIVRHFFDKRSNKDYLVSTSYEKSCKIWCVKTFTCLLTIQNCHTGNYVYSALVLTDIKDDKTYVVTTSPNEATKVWNLSDGSHVRDILTNTDYTYFLNSWYDHVNDKTYIINANSFDVKMYDFHTGFLYKAYKASISTWHMSAFAHTIDNKAYLFESDGNGYIRIWDVHTATIHQTMQAPSCNLRGLCLWNDNYLIAASSDKSFKVFDLKTGKLKDSIPCHDNVLCTVDKILHPIHGEALLTTAIDGKLKLWTK